MNSGNANEESLLKRAFMFLEDGDWSAADEYCEKVLDIDPENARAYLGKLMAECRARRMEDLQNCEQPFDGSGNYNKILRFAEPKLIETLKGYIAHINERNENARLTGIYNRAVSAMNEANSENGYKAAAEIFKTVPGFKDADSLVEKCLDNAETCRKDALYHSARSQMSQNTISSYESAIRMFESIPGWKDADEQIYACKKKIEELKAKQEADRLERERIEEKHRIAAEKAKKKIKKIITITAPIVCVLIVFLILLKTVIIPKQKYNAAVAKYGQEYVDAFYALNVGDTLVFGTYEQDNDTTNGKEDIEWLVLTKENNKILVVSDKALDCKPYNQSRDYVTWETCSLRNWLNNDFINAAFTAEERAMIPTVTVSADMNPNTILIPETRPKTEYFS